MMKDNSMNRREFIGKAAKTIAVVGVASTIRIPITTASCKKKEETSAGRANDDHKKMGRHGVNKQAANTYYISRKPELLKAYDKGTKPLGKILGFLFDEEHTNIILMEARQEFESIIPGIPYIGGDKNFNTKNLIMASSCLAIYRVLKNHGKTPEETGKIIYEMTEALVDYPKFVLHLIGRFKFGKAYERRMKAWAAESQNRKYPGDWVSTFIEGDGREFDYGFDITDCGILKYFHSQGADEITPYICVSIDGIFSRAFNRGLVRTTTLAEGYDKCDFRYKRGRETLLLPLRDGWPPQFHNR